MISLALAFAPIATLSLFAAAVPVLTGLRQRNAFRARPERAGDHALGLSVAPEADGGRLVVSLRNRTERVHPAALCVSLYDAAGAEVARFDLPARRILPGRTAQETLSLNSIPEGRYQAVVVVEFGGGWYGGRYAWTRSAAAPAAAAA